MTVPEPSPPRDLRTLFCERYRCPSAQFEKRALRKCLYFHAMLLAPLLRWINPKCFERDLLFIHYFGNAKNMQEVTVEVLALRDQNNLRPRFGRNTLKLRISGRKANQLALKFFPAPS